MEIEMSQTYDVNSVGFVLSAVGVLLSICLKGIVHGEREFAQILFTYRLSAIW